MKSNAMGDCFNNQRNEFNSHLIQYRMLNDKYTSINSQSYNHQYTMHSITETHRCYPGNPSGKPTFFGDFISHKLNTKGWDIHIDCVLLLMDKCQFSNLRHTFVVHEQAPWFLRPSIFQWVTILKLSLLLLTSAFVLLLPSPQEWMSFSAPTFNFYLASLGRWTITMICLNFQGKIGHFSLCQKQLMFNKVLQERLFLRESN